MRVAYLDCSTGISGDMTLAALIDAGVDAAAIRRAIDSLGLAGVALEIKSVLKEGFRATHVRVTHPEQHAHRHLSDILAIVDRAPGLTPSQKELARRIFRAVAEAEAKVHGQSVESIHFHEVGAIDSIVDIVGAAVGFDLLGADLVVSSPVPTGRGQVRIAHGICTVPTPGTAELLKGVPLVDVPVEAELTTPTGAAILATVVDRFDALPEMTIEAIGYGAGTLDLPGRANVLRLFVGSARDDVESDQVMLLETNLDDVSGEVIGYAKRRLMDAGALDVFSTPIQMKKDRPAVLLSVIARPADAARLEAVLFDETGTFGVRRQRMERAKRARRAHTVDTPFGPVAGKLGWRSGGRAVFTPEYESCAAIAAEAGVSLREVQRAAQAAFEKAPAPEWPTLHDHPALTPVPSHPGEHPRAHDHDHHHHDHDHDHDGHHHDH
ncbi:MAG: nickel pincer cofactor biosynthesis protein LarC [Planctomycetaceae bacterium]